MTVIDRLNHHLFQPLLYQVATAGLSPADIAMPVRAVLHGRNDTDVLMASVEKVDVATKTLILDRGEVVRYNYLLVATGARHSYFAHPEWEALAPGLKTLEDATEIRRRILIAFEEAERSPDPATRAALLTFVIVGAGPTGIELAGAIAELRRFALAKDFARINSRLARIILIEAGPRILASFPEKLSAAAAAALVRLGVEIQVDQRVTAITGDGVTAGGSFIAAKTVIWAAGVKPSKLASQLGAPLDRGGRVIVERDLSVAGHPEIFVGGDVASVAWKDDQTVPGMAPGAMQEGRRAARNILKLIAGQPTEPFQYIDKGSLATIGRASAVVSFAGINASGLVAWWIWLSVHIFYLIGFRNRLLVLIQWAWSYLTFQRGTRLITGGHGAQRPAAD